MINQYSFSEIKEGMVLGVEAVKNNMLTADTIFIGIGRTIVTRVDVKNVLIALSFGVVISILLFTSGWFWYGIKRAIRKRNIILMIFIGLMSSILQLYYQIKVVPGVVAEKMMENRTPRDVLIERISPDLIDVGWSTKGKMIAAVMWGYDVDRLENIALCQKGSKGEKVM